MSIFTFWSTQLTLTVSLEKYHAERCLCFKLTWGGRGHSIARTRPCPRKWWGGGWCSGSSDWSGSGGSTRPAPRRRSAASPGRPQCSPGPSCRSRRRRSGQTPPPPGTESSAAAPFPPPSSLPHAQWSLGHNRNKTVWLVCGKYFLH